MEEPHRVVQACAAALEATAKPERQAAEDAATECLEHDPSASLYALITAVPMCQDLNPGLAQLCAIRAKNFLKNEMKETHEVDLALIKNALVLAVPAAQDNTRRLLVECARVVHAEEDWADLAPQLVMQLSESSNRSKQDPAARQQCLAALQLLYVITRQFKMVDLVTQEEQDETSSTFLPMLPPLFDFGDLRIAHMVLKIFESFVQQFTPTVLKDAALFEGWMNFMLTFASDSRPEVDLNSPDYVMYVKCMKRIAAISYRMVQLACRRGKKRPKAAQHFVANFSESFVNLWVAWLRFMAPLDHETKVQHAKVTVNAMRYLRECGGLEEVYGYLPIDELNTSLLFPYFPFNEDDEELWASDVNEYLRRLKASTGDKTDMRHAATKAMMTFVTTREKAPFQDPSHLPVLLQFVQAGLQEAPSRDTDGYLHILGMLHKFAKRVPGFAEAMPSVLVEHIAPLLSNENSVLRAKAIWICGLFAGVPFEDESQFEAMLRAVLSALEDTEAPVRMQVISSLANFLSLRKSRPFLRECLVPLTKECVRLVDDNNSDFAVEALQALVEVFGPELSVQLGEVCRSLVQRCRAVRFDLSQATEAAQRADYNEEGDQASENLSFALESTLRAISSCVESLGYDAQTLQTLQVQLCDLVLEVIGDGDLDQTDIALQIFDRLVFFGKDALDAKCWDVFDVMCDALLVQGAVDLFDSYLPILDNLCSNQPQNFTRQDRLEKVFAMCTKMLSKDMIGSCLPKCIAAAPELMACMFQQLRPYRPAMDEAAGPLLTLTLQSLVVHESVDIRVGLCTVLMCALYYDPEATLGTMDSCNATAFVLPSYCDLLERKENRDKHLSTALGRKTHVIGICSYVMYALANGRPEAEAVAGRMMALAARMTKQNLQAYEGQLQALQKLLSGQARQAERDGADGYESDDSMEVEEDEEDGGGESDDEPYVRRVGGGEGDDEDDDDDELEIESALDAVCEVEALYNTIAQCPAEVQTLFTAAWPTVHADLPAAQELSAEVIATRAQVRSSAAELHAARANSI